MPGAGLSCVSVLKRLCSCSKKEQRNDSVLIKGERMIPSLACLSPEESGSPVESSATGRSLQLWPDNGWLETLLNREIVVTDCVSSTGLVDWLSSLEWIDGVIHLGNPGFNTDYLKLNRQAWGLTGSMVLYLYLKPGFWVCADNRSRVVKRFRWHGEMTIEFRLTIENWYLTAQQSSGPWTDCGDVPDEFLRVGSIWNPFLNSHKEDREGLSGKISESIREHPAIWFWAASSELDRSREKNWQVLQ